MWLLMARNIFSRQPATLLKHYITRLVFNDRHWTLLMIRQGAVFGGIIFRPFPGLDFAEIVFCAISSAEQSRSAGISRHGPAQKVPAERRHRHRQHSDVC
jgi:histone acetyltransferase